jgi:hypothetical protein
MLRLVVLCDIIGEVSISDLDPREPGRIFSRFCAVTRSRYQDEPGCGRHLSNDDPSCFEQDFFRWIIPDSLYQLECIGDQRMLSGIVGDIREICVHLHIIKQETGRKAEG